MSLFAQDEVDRRLPCGGQIFLDHVGHFVRDAAAAARALDRAGFSPAPASIQVNPDAGAGTRLTGTGNVTAMLSRGYVEVLFKTADTALGREFDAALARHAGLHLTAFAVADAEKAHERLVAEGFAVRPLANMQRPVESADGEAVAAFAVVRVDPAIMPEGRIQMLTHHTEEAVWQQRWLSHRNGAMALVDVVIAVADVDEAARRIARFTGCAAARIPGGAFIRLDRGGVVLATLDRLAALLPEVAIAGLPFIAAYAVGVRSLATLETAMASGALEWRAFQDGIVARFPGELGDGAWFFVESAAALPWRR